MVQAADLVIAATREVRGFIDTIAPGTTHRVYTLLELAQLLKEAPQSRGLGTLGVVELAMSRRTGGTLAQDANDLADPRGEAAEAYRIMVKTVSAALDVIAPALLPVPSTETSPGHS
jgi:protein-tyrosine-phosphatase